jgi:drug/metabolite transporter (DMT)-like permease
MESLTTMTGVSNDAEEAQTGSVTARPNTLGSTVVGLGAIALWAILAALTALAGSVPAFQLAAMTFAIGALVGLVWAKAKGLPLAGLKSVPLGAWALGVYGLLGFHVSYFLALRHAPVIEASLIVYLWPLLIVLLSGLLPASVGGSRLAWWHIAGALLGLAGAVILVAGSGNGLALSGSGVGYGLAIAAALIWSSYSVASRLFRQVPSTAVIGSCAATASGALALHLALETTRWPDGLGAWLAVIGLGLGPVGLAFYLWDEGMKYGDIRMLGIASYATPILSTIILAAAGLGSAHAGIWLAALLVTAGALLASKDQLMKPQTRRASRPGD